MESVREMIEKRAYELFLKRGGEHGYHYQDWLQAEKDIMATLDKKPSSEAKAKPVMPKPAAVPATPAAAAKKPALKKR